MQFKYDSPYIKLYSQKRACKQSNQESKTEAAAEVKTVKEPPGLAKPTKSITTFTYELVNTYIKPGYRNKLFKE